MTGHPARRLRVVRITRTRAACWRPIPPVQPNAALILPDGTRRPMVAVPAAALWPLREGGA